MELILCHKEHLMFRSILCGCAAVALTSAIAQPANSAEKRDLTGIWTNASKTTLERPNGITELEVTPQQAKAIVDARDVIGYKASERAQLDHADPNAPPPPAGDKDFGVKGYDVGWISPGEGLDMVNGKYRTSHIIEPADGHIPYKDMEAAKKLAVANGLAYTTGNGPFDGPEGATVGERCILGNGSTGGPGMLSVLYNNDYQFVLTKDHLAIDVEMDHDVRIIPIFATAHKAKASHGPINRWLGDSVAWWQGDTLVVESIHVPALEGGFGPIALSSQAKVTEYLTRNGPKQINYKFTVEDPVNYTRPWTAEMTFQPINAIYEFACHEGNYALEGILAGARAQETERASAGK
jgi:hypothetical protein